MMMVTVTSSGRWRLGTGEGGACGTGDCPPRARCFKNRAGIPSGCFEGSDGSLRLMPLVRQCTCESPCGIGSVGQMFTVDSVIVSELLMQLSVLTNDFGMRS